MRVNLLGTERGAGSRLPGIPRALARDRVRRHET